MKIMGGSWPDGQDATVQRGSAGTLKTITLHLDPNMHDEIPINEIESANLVTQENQASVARTLGWGAVAVAGSIGDSRSSRSLVAIKFRDGRAVLLTGKLKEVAPLLVRTYRC
jgi:hypothetical protein